MNDNIGDHMSDNIGDLNVTATWTTSGHKCVFPFKAFGKIYHNCTTDLVTVKSSWCSLTSDWDVDHKTGWCDFSKTR